MRNILTRGDLLQCVEQISIGPVDVGQGENFLWAEHLPGLKNTTADEESRTVRDQCNWMIHPRVFAHLQQKMGPLEVDMFASRLTYQLRRFFSWRPDPLAEATDAFAQSWRAF